MHVMIFMYMHACILIFLTLGWDVSIVKFKITIFSWIEPVHFGYNPHLSRSCLFLTTQTQRVLNSTLKCSLDKLYCRCQVAFLNFLPFIPNIASLSSVFHFSSVPHTRSLEARIKEELVAQGLLDSEERPGPGGDSEDEVLAELQKRQAELKALSAHNRARKQELLRWGHKNTVDALSMK